MNSKSRTIIRLKLAWLYFLKYVICPTKFGLRIGWVYTRSYIKLRVILSFLWLRYIPVLRFYAAMIAIGKLEWPFHRSER